MCEKRISNMIRNRHSLLNDAAHAVINVRRISIHSFQMLAMHNNFFSLKICTTYNEMNAISSWLPSFIPTAFAACIGCVNFLWNRITWYVLIKIVSVLYVHVIRTESVYTMNENVKKNESVRRESEWVLFGECLQLKRKKERKKWFPFILIPFCYSELCEWFLLYCTFYLMSLYCFSFSLFLRWTHLNCSGHRIVAHDYWNVKHLLFLILFSGSLELYALNQYAAMCSYLHFIISYYGAPQSFLLHIVNLVWMCRWQLTRPEKK